MRIGIIEAGAPPAALQADFGSYVAMTCRLLGAHHHFETYPVTGHLPSPGRHEAFIVTGSACSVYDDQPWIPGLETFLRSARGRTKLIGICFGHQIMAQAFGGRVEKAPQGWGLGLHRYEIKERKDWMDDVDAVYAIASHQDQVTELPPNSRVLGASSFTPCAVLSYQDHPALSVQFHPEFNPAFASVLFADRTAPDLREDQLAQAISSLSGHNDNLRIGTWFNRFLVHPD